MTQKVSRKRVETRKRLLDAARVTIAEMGISGANVGAIAKQANFTRGAFYSNFETKDELISALIYEEFEQLLDNLELNVRNILATRGSQQLPADKQELAAAIANIMNPIVDSLPMGMNFYLLWLELNMYSAREGESSLQFFAHNSRLITKLAEIIEHGFAEIGLTFILPVQEITEIVIAIIQRSFLVYISDSKSPESPTVEGQEPLTPTTFARQVLPITMASFSIDKAAVVALAH